MTALNRIAADLRRLADYAGQPDYQICPFDLRHIARQIEAQDELAVIDAPAPTPEAPQ
jgi:hypothetical protein